MSILEQGFNLPPGVSPNDPHLTGECPGCGATGDDDESRYCPPCRRVADQIRAETIEEMRR